MGINFELYKTFYYVAKYRNITHAAKALFQTQPTVSRCIAQLEAQLGCRLFVRSQKGVSLTPEAEILYHHVSAACEEIFCAEQQLDQQKNLREGLVRIGASEMTLHHGLLHFLGFFRENYPEVRIQISGFNTPSAMQALKREEIDLAVVISPYPQSSEFQVQTLSKFQDIVIAGRGFSQLTGRVLCLQDLNNYPLICLQSGTGTRQHLEEFFEQHGQQLRPDIELPTTDLIVPLVEQNLGIGIVPENFAAQALKKRSVFTLCLQEQFPLRQISAITHASHPLSLAAQQFLQLLVEQKEF